jgi:histidinol-phosphatase
MSDLDLERALHTARSAVEAASAAALVHFRRGVRVEIKPDRTPVTVADRESEAAAAAVIRAAFPGHGFVGEETGTTQGGGEARWIVDPIDGTRGFTRGGSFWGPLVALEHRGEIVAGAMAMPALSERYWAARGLGAFVQRGGEGPERLRVSGISAWGDATLSLGEMHFLLAPELAPKVLRLTATCAQARCYGDLAGCAMLLTGRAEAWLEAGVKSWDLAALKILVEEAGGLFTDFAGRPTAEAGNCVASNGRVHEHVLSVLGGG